MTDCWSLTTNEKVNIVEWETNFSVYNPLTGETHLINAFPAEIIRFLMEQPASSVQIIQYITRLCDEEQTAEWRLRIRHVLKQLEAIDLIELSE